MTKKILYELQDISLIYETINDDKEDTAYLPGMDINQLSVGVLLNRLDAAGSEKFKVNFKQHIQSWDILVKSRNEYIYKNSEVLLKDL